MFIALFLSVPLILGGLRGAAASDLQFYGKSLHSGKGLLRSEDGRHTMKKQPHQQNKGESLRSLDLESFKIHTTPASKISLPTIVKLYPPTPPQLNRHANIPMRFGRQNSIGEDGSQNSPPNLPQRFGRNKQSVKMCPACLHVRGAVNAALIQRNERNRLYWRLLRTLVSDQILSSNMHWTEDYDLSASSEEIEMPDEIR